MQLSKKKYKKNYAMRFYFLKTSIIALNSLIIYLTIAFHDFLLNSIYKAIHKKMKKDNFFSKDNEICDKFDPIVLMADRFKRKAFTICNNKKSKHICYLNSKFINTNKIYKSKNGMICLSKNIILDPLKSSQTKYIYKGPVDKKNRGAPILSKGFLNMKCKNLHNIRGYNKIYKNYLDSWDYEYKKEIEQTKELAPGKTILFISRNQDSPNLFHGISELINIISIMYLFDLNPENIQIIFLESMILKDDPLYKLYEKIISRGGKPIYIRDLKQKYYISSAIHIPINWDSPLFIRLQIPRGYPDCKYSTQTYNIFNNLINKYLNITDFQDSFISDNKTFYYSESIIKNSKLNNTFNRSITIQWRKVWPKGRIYQQRLLGNAIELTDKLSSILPKNYLVRLVDTASLSIIEQISIMRKTDYLIGIHGAGLSLSIFMPTQSVLYEILPKSNNKDPVVMSSLSGHKTYSDILKSESKSINNNEFIFFDVSEFINNTLKYISI